MLPGMNPDLTINYDFFILLFVVNTAIVILIGFGYAISIWIKGRLRVKELEKRHKWIMKQIKNP